MSHVLDNPPLTSLAGVHRDLGIHTPGASRYRSEISPFAALEGADFTALERIVDEAPVALFQVDRLPDSWRVVSQVSVIQMVCDEPLIAPEQTFQRLGSQDAANMLRLAQQTQPGPFAIRTVEMGHYRGLYVGDQLVAMAGERLKPTGYVEVSGVCTDPAYRGHGYAAALVRVVGSAIQAQGLVPFLYVAAGSPSELTARGVYERLGFRQRCRQTLTIVHKDPHPAG
ncbi:MAG: GNAT family N-acetyltransferase [Proteobacteria bacterium]|nr:GNAT family N-acetyltransferase [Pseudomonadota bacterium]